MSSIKPKIPAELDAIVAPTKGKIKLSNYYAHAHDYPSFSEFLDTDNSKKETTKLALDILENSQEQLFEADQKLWASKKYAVLLILQGMDTAGKDGTINHVMSGLSPQGCRVESFKTPTPEEHAHNFLWRYSKALPKRGEIVIFNRSHYEDVLVTKVHPEYLEMLPPEVSLTENKDFWKDRYKDINAFEKHLARNGTLIIKFFLYISKDEQKARLLERMTNEDKYWKVSPADMQERGFWDKYIGAYEDMISNTSTDNAPWIIVPANDKKSARAIVAHAISSTINAMNIDFPTVSFEQMEILRQAKKQLENEE